MRQVLMLVCCALMPAVALAWGGYDVDSGGNIEIESGNLVREGEMVEIYDYDADEYRDVSIESVNGDGQLEVYDYETDEYRTFEMDE